MTTTMAVPMRPPRRRPLLLLSLLLVCVSLACVSVFGELSTPYIAPMYFATFFSRQSVPGAVPNLTPEQQADPNIGFLYAPSEFGDFTLAGWRIAEIAFVDSLFYALRSFNGSVRFGSTINGNNGPWTEVTLPGTYLHMTNADYHICFLSSEHYISCHFGGLSFRTELGALFEAQAATRFSQVSAGGACTCALRLDDSRVECHGALSSDRINFYPVNLTSSSLQYSHIAAQSNRGFCGLVLGSGDLACWNYGLDGANATEVVTLPAPTAPLFWRSAMWCGASAFGCALRSDGEWQCQYRLQHYFGDQTPAMSATDQSVFVVTADQASAQMRYYYEPYEPTTWQDVWVFFPMRFIAVDPRDGDDQSCNCVITPDLTQLPGFVACRTLDRAIELLTVANTWVQLLPGSHTTAGFTIHTAETTFSSGPPPTLTADELATVANGTWRARMDEAAATGQGVIIDCTGATHCVTFSQSLVAFTDLTFRGSSAHALNNPTADRWAALQTTLTLDRIVFDQCGGAIVKNLGTLIVRNSSFTNVRSDSQVLGIVELDTVSLTMSDCVFADNTLPFADTFLRSCLRTEHLGKQIRVDIERTVWRNNTASSGQVAGIDRYRAPGGVAIQALVADSFQLYVTDCLFEDQTVLCESCNGGAVAIITDVPPTNEDYSIVLLRSVWNRCIHRDPASDGESVVGNTYGGALAISELDVRASGMWRGLTTAALVVISLCTFRDSQAVFGGCIAIGIVKDLDIKQSTFIGCRAEATGGAIRIESITNVLNSYTHTPLAFAQTVYSLSVLTFHDSFAKLDGGAIFAQSVTTTLSVLSSQFYNSSARNRGGAIALVGCSFVSIQDSAINGSSAAQGGAIDTDATANTIIQGSSFTHTRAMTAGGAIATSNNDIKIFHSNFTDCALAYSAGGQSAAKVVDRLGGALACVGGSAGITSSAFTACSALPNDLQLSTCAEFYDSATGLSSIGLGGVIDGHLTAIDLFDITARDCRACSGGVVSSRSGSAVIRGSSIGSVRAHAGGIMTALASVPINVDGNVAVDVSAVAAGGALVLNQCETIELFTNDVQNISCTAGDGGFLWLHALRRPQVLIIMGHFFRDVTSPAGAGAMLFLQYTAGAFAAPDDIQTPSFDNHISHAAGGTIALYGVVQASGLASLSWDGSVVQVYAGQLFSELSHPLQIAALDVYGSRIMQNRDIVVQVVCPDVEFRGTTLQQVTAQNGTALFSDLRILAAPGRYQLVFSVVSQSNVFVNVSLSVSSQCPAGSFFSVAGRTCTTCASGNILVFNTTLNECLPCPAGHQRSNPALNNATGGPLNDGVFCELCPLGQVSSSGSSCTACGPNTYQPTPFSPCVACSNVNGLLCAGDGLAQVETNFFAMSSIVDGEQRIQTFLCPAGFCSAAKLQRAGTGGSSAVTAYDQCAYPRLASPTNLLCGECAEGYRPWGNRCSKCESTNGGLLFLLIVLSFALCAWLLRAAMVTSAAGHSVIILYFIQTVMLELGTINRLLSWLNFTLFSPNSTSDCIVPLSPYQQVQAQVLMPVALELELIAIGLMHWAAFKRWGAQAQSERAPADGSPLAARFRHSALWFVSQFSVDVYVNATLSLLLFSYTQVCAACVNYLQCVDVGGVSVVFNQPAMYCESDAYKQTRGLVVAALVFFVAGLPAGIALFLATKKTQLAAAYRFIDQRIAAEESDSDAPAAAPSSSSATARFVARYAPLFAMYSPSTSFWQLFVVLRRICFVAIAVLLVRDPEQKFMAFVLAHVVSQLAQLVAQPFRLRILNAADFVAHMLLILISATLTAHPPPESGGVDLFIFMLVVPPLCLYPLVMLLQHSHERKTKVAEMMRKQIDKEDEVAAGAGAGLSADEIEMHTMHENPARKSLGGAQLYAPADSGHERGGSELAAWSNNPAAAVAASPSSSALASPSHSGGSRVSTAAAAAGPMEPSSGRLEPRPAPMQRSFSLLSHASRRSPGSPAAGSQAPRRPHLAGLLLDAENADRGAQQPSASDELEGQSSVGL